MADFQNRLISRIFGVFLSGFSKRFFAQNYFIVLVESISACFLEFSFLTQNEHFAKPIALPKWPIFKILLFLQYLVFFGAVFWTELLYCARRIDFCMFFGILIFDPK